MRIHRYGHDALLVDVPDAATALALVARVRARAVPARDIVPAARSVLLDGLSGREEWAREIAGWEVRPEPPRAGGEVVDVPTRYDGADLEDVARRWGMTTEEVIGTHTGSALVVAFCGFAPGFAYCTGLADHLAVPRHHDPRPRVPPGAVALAGTFTGVYPTASPGGWRLIGHTDLRLWDVSREQPATLPPGTRVRFVRV